MRRPSIRSGIVPTGLLCAVLSGAAGCSAVESVGRYFQYRFEDFCEVADVGLTITTTPQWGFYWNSLEVLLFGYSDVDGYFLGFGGGGIGIRRHSNKCYGLIVGVEEVGWSGNLSPDPIPEENIHKRMSGVPGILMGLTGSGEYGAGPNYTPACVHFFPHIGYVGLVWNLRYMEFVDFFLGWFGLDISGDDGRQVGRWNIPGLTPSWEDTEEGGPSDGGSAPGTLSRAPADPVAPPEAAPSEPVAEPKKAAEPEQPPASTVDAEPEAPAAQPIEVSRRIAPPEKPTDKKTLGGIPNFYVVQTGDGLMKIAREQLGNVKAWRQIADLNGISLPYNLKPGKVLRLPTN